MYSNKQYIQYVRGTETSSLCLEVKANLCFLHPSRRITTEWDMLKLIYYIDNEGKPPKVPMNEPRIEARDHIRPTRPSDHNGSSPKTH